MSKMRYLGAGAAALVLLGAIGLSQIKEMTLPEMMAEADAAVFGQITESHVFAGYDPQEQTELYYTSLTVEGRRVGDSTPVTLDIVYLGGFIDEDHGIYNAEAPAADDVKVGNRIVAFYKWMDDIGCGVPGNALVGAHGGLYRTAAGPRGTMVLGRGQGYAVSTNRSLEKLDAQVRELRRR